MGAEHDVSCLQRVARFIDAEEIDAAPIIDYGGLNEEPEEFWMKTNNISSPEVLSLLGGFEIKIDET